MALAKKKKTFLFIYAYHNINISKWLINIISYIDISKIISKKCFCNTFFFQIANLQLLKLYVSQYRYTNARSIR